MYLPAHFAETRLDVLHDAIRRTGLATLVTVGADGIVANHVPLILDPTVGPNGTLYGHLARGNPQWRDVAEATGALAIFLGPNAYVSPAWYPTKQATGQVVPTWNFLAVHAYGPLNVYEDHERLRAHVARLTAHHEAGRPEPWAVDDAPEPYVQGMLKGIVGIEIPIRRLEGKWKLSQNRPAEDRAGALAGLAASADPQAQQVAALMRHLDSN